MQTTPLRIARGVNHGLTIERDSRKSFASAMDPGVPSKTSYRRSRKARGYRPRPGLKEPDIRLQRSSQQRLLYNHASLKCKDDWLTILMSNLSQKSTDSVSRVRWFGDTPTLTTVESSL